MRPWLMRVTCVAFALLLAVPVMASDVPAMPGVPAEVQAVVNKVAGGQPLSAQDQKVLEAYQKSVETGQPYRSPLKPGGGGAAAGKSGGDNAGAGAAFAPIAVGSGEEQSPCMPPSHAIGFGTTPSRDAYVAMAARVFKHYASTLAPADRTSMSSALSSGPNATSGSDVAPMLMVLGETSSAIYAASYAAQKVPSDVLGANNLGAILKGAKDYADAAIALRYAQSLAPTSPLIATNLGWLAMNQGDSATAGPFFSAATKGAPHMAMALSGQGLIQACAGRPSKALPLFRASLAAGFSELAMDGIEMAEQAIENNAKPDTTPDLGSPDAYGPKSSNVPDWPRPPLPEEVETMAAYGGGNPSALVQYTTSIAGQISQMAATIAAGGPTGAATHFDGHEIIFRRGYDDETFVLSDLRTILGKELGKPMDDLNKDVEAFQKDDGCLLCAGGGQRPAPTCANQTRVKSVYPKYYPRFNDDLAKLQQAIADVYGFSEPWLARIHDPAIRRAEKAALDQFVLTYLENFGQEMVIVGMETNAAWDIHVEQSCSAAGEKKPKDQKVKPYKIDATKCKMKPTSMPMPFVSMSGDCDKLSVSLGIDGFGGSAEYKFPPDFVLKDGVYVANGGADGEWTLFGGLSVSSSAEIPVGVGASAGPYISFQGGHMTDAGVQAQAAAGINVAKLSASEGATARVGLTSGANVSPSGLGTGADWGTIAHDEAPAP